MHSDDDDSKSPTLAAKIMSLYRTGEYRDPRASTTDIQRVDAGVATIDLELDAPDDVIDVVPESSGMTVELVDGRDAATLSDASLDRLAADRAAKYPSPARTQSSIAPVYEAPCEEPYCPVMMADAACDASPGARCAQSLERVGVACSSVCDVLEPAPPAAAQCPVSMVDEVCQTEPTWSTRSSTLATGTETETDFDKLYSDETDDISQVSKAETRNLFRGRGGVSSRSFSFSLPSFPFHSLLHPPRNGSSNPAKGFEERCKLLSQRGERNLLPPDTVPGL